MSIWWGIVTAIAIFGVGAICAWPIITELACRREKILQELRVEPEDLERLLNLARQISKSERGARRLVICHLNCTHDVSYAHIMLTDALFLQRWVDATLRESTQEEGETSEEVYATWYAWRNQVGYLQEKEDDDDDDSEGGMLIPLATPA